MSVEKLRSSVLIAGIAPGLGCALATELASAGYDVVGIARSDRVAEVALAGVTRVGQRYTHIKCDLTNPVGTASALKPYVEDVEIAVYNAHALLIKPFAETPINEFERVWRVGCYGAAALAQALLPSMVKRGNGTLIFSGATAGVRGGAEFSAFASAKFGLRGMAQSLAREYGPRGIHICHVVLDGLIDEPQTTTRFGSSSSVADRMDPSHIARCYRDLAEQHHSGWTHELDMRPFSEPF